MADAPQGGSRRPPLWSVRAGRVAPWVRALHNLGIDASPDPGTTDDGPPRELLQRARLGDRAALADLLREVRPRLHLAARAGLGERMRGRLHASDIVQSTYVRVLSHVTEFHGSTRQEFAAWVFRILERTIKERLRFFEAARRARARESSSTTEHLLAPSTSPSSDAAFADELVLLARAMDQLPKDYARILTLHMDPHQTHSKTARTLQRSEGACRVMLARARAALLVELKLLGSSLDAD
ncbi:MAG: RNA polymerase sigma factor [Planctomycetota bacterium]